MSKISPKLTSSHTSLTDSAKQIVLILDRDSHVSKISAGFIKAGLRPLKSGTKRIKINQSKKYLLLSVRGNTSHQELHVYTDNPEQTIANLQKKLKHFSLSTSS